MNQSDPDNGTVPNVPRVVTTRRQALRGAAALAACTAAVTVSTIAAATPAPEEPLTWQISDGRFNSWFFFEGDTLVMDREPVPMKESGLYVVREDGGDRLVFVTVGIMGKDVPTETAFILDGPGKYRDASTFNRLSPDARMGHRILWHRPKYWLGDPVTGTRS